MFGTMFFLPRARFAALPRTRAMSSSVPPLVQNLVRPKDWKATAPAAPAGTSTYGQQAKLGRLPVPELKDTFSRLAESLAPLARNAAELSATQAKISAFADGLAPQLQERLKARQVETANWLEDWWDDGESMFR
jgi:carnitine O-acetyltransferase